MSNKFIVTTGNPNEGFKYHGTFKTNENAMDWGLHHYSHSGFFVSELNIPEKTYTITEEQLKAIKMGLELGHYFVDNQEPYNNQHENDSESIKSAFKAFNETYKQEVTE
jgi:hypothetical protein